MKLQDIAESSAPSDAQKKLYTAIEKSVRTLVKLAAKGVINCNSAYLRAVGNLLKASVLEGAMEFHRTWSKLLAEHPDLFAFLADEVMQESGVKTFDELISKYHLGKGTVDYLKAQLGVKNLTKQEIVPAILKMFKDAHTKAGPSEHGPAYQLAKVRALINLAIAHGFNYPEFETLKKTVSEQIELHEAESEEDDSDDDETDENSDDSADDSDDESDEDVGEVASKEGYVKSKKEMYAFGATRPVTLLTKNERLGGMDLTLQYVINPKTGAWSLRACHAGQTEGDMVEFTTGEDPSSLVKNLKKQKKITPHQAVEFLNPPADKAVKKDDDDVNEAARIREGSEDGIPVGDGKVVKFKDKKAFLKLCLEEMKRGSFGNVRHWVEMAKNAGYDQPEFATILASIRSWFKQNDPDAE